MTAATEPRYLDVPALATYISLSPKAIRRLVEKAHIPHMRVGRSVRFDREMIDRWMAKKIDGRKPQ